MVKTSGLDEQFNDIGICPACKCEIDMWILQSNHEYRRGSRSDSWIWINSTRRMASNIFKKPEETFPSYQIIGKAKVEDMELAICCTHHITLHEYRKGTPQFDKLMQYLLNEIRRNE